MTYATAELEPATWQDFERLFRPGTGWAFCACMLYQRGCHLLASEYPKRDVVRTENQRQKRELVATGRAHGVLVYDDDEPIGWCQFGPVEELPLPGSTRLDRRIPPLAPDVDWRITCFVTAVRHRHRGVARAALDGALAGGQSTADHERPLEPSDDDRDASMYWDIRDIQFHCRIGRSTAWRLVREDGFPAPVLCGKRIVLWPRVEVMLRAHAGWTAISGAPLGEPVQL